MSQTLDPVAALREIATLLERGGGESRRARAFRGAAQALLSLSPSERADHDRARSWSTLPGIGRTTGAVIAQAVAGEVPQYLAQLRAQAVPLVPGDNPLLAALHGDLHVHSAWSDGCCSIEEMMGAARARGHAYSAITDHSPNLTVANGLDASRLAAQLTVIEQLNGQLAPFRCLAGIETDILEDGRLDQSPDMLRRLDVVVASVHSKLRTDADTMTRRMVAALANPRTNILGHCTGRLLTGDRGRRPESRFDAEVVFEACRRFGVAVEINSRPERLDPPMRLLRLAAEIGCLFAIDTDAHAPGQLEFQAYGARRASDAGIAADRIVNTWALDDLLDWCRP